VLFAVSLVGTIFVARKQVKLLYVIIVFAVVLLFVIIALVGSKPYTDFMTREDQKYDMFLKMETDPTVGLKFSYTGFGSFRIALAVIAGLGYAGLGALQAKSLFANK
jgi:cell division protein FtsW (lipid II flippase)